MRAFSALTRLAEAALAIEADAHGGAVAAQQRAQLFYRDGLAGQSGYLRTISVPQRLIPVPMPFLHLPQPFLIGYVIVNAL
jgi:hypothetical protein